VLKCDTLLPIMATLSKTEPFRIRIERGRKARAAKILQRFGLTPGEAVNVFFAKVEEVGGLPFDLRPTSSTAISYMESEYGLSSEDAKQIEANLVLESIKAEKAGEYTSLEKITHASAGRKISKKSQR
jgi:addiction module RelB/DinJ family antitoxin